MTTQVEKTIVVKVMDINHNEHTIEISNFATGYQLKVRIYEVSQSLTQHQMKLVHAGTQILNNQKLCDFHIAIGSILQFEQSKIDLNQVSKIVAVQEEDPISGESITVKMPCGHVIGRDSMVGLVRSLIDAKKYHIICPSKDQNNVPCLMEWDYKICKKIGVFTKQQKELFQQGLSMNWIKAFSKECPHCKKGVSKGDLQINRVKCPACKGADFCYFCLQPWKGKDNKFCGSETCTFYNDMIVKAPWNRIFKLKDTKNNNQIIQVMTPQYRLCPNCNISTQNYINCKHTKCLGCNKSFCWVCLSTLKTNWQCGSFGEYCGKVAQVQVFKTWQ